MVPRMCKKACAALIQTRGEEMNWNNELMKITALRDVQVKSIMATYFFMTTYNRALMILGDGTCRQKVHDLHSAAEGLAARWKRMLKLRLGSSYKDLASVVTQNGVQWSRVNLGVLAVLDRMRYGFGLAINNGTNHAVGNVAHILIGAKRIKEYVEGFGIDFDVRINPTQIRRLIERWV